jgi:hypothetical protein
MGRPLIELSQAELIEAIEQLVRELVDARETSRRLFDLRLDRPKTKVYADLGFLQYTRVGVISILRVGRLQRTRCGESILWGWR